MRINSSRTKKSTPLISSAIGRFSAGRCLLLAGQVQFFSYKYGGNRRWSRDMAQLPPTLCHVNILRGVILSLFNQFICLFVYICIYLCNGFYRISPAGDQWQGERITLEQGRRGCRCKLTKWQRYTTYFIRY